MPGAFVQGNKLQDLSVSSDQKVGRNPEMVDFLEIRVLRRVQPIEKKILDPWSAKLLWRQADIVNHQQIYRRVCRPIITIW